MRSQERSDVQGKVQSCSGSQVVFMCSDMDKHRRLAIFHHFSFFSLPICFLGVAAGLLGTRKRRSVVVEGLPKGVPFKALFGMLYKDPF